VSGERLAETAPLRTRAAAGLKVRIPLVLDKGAIGLGGTWRPTYEFLASHRSFAVTRPRSRAAGCVMSDRQLCNPLRLCNRLLLLGRRVLQSASATCAALGLPVRIAPKERTVSRAVVTAVLTAGPSPASSVGPSVGPGRQRGVSRPQALLRGRAGSLAILAHAGSAGRIGRSTKARSAGENLQ
jgi:hypothetical protein